MSADFDKNATELLARCARHCCICRRFRPTKLQVHHILPREDGGTDEPENLIAVCLTCHSDVHTHRPFCRRFTPLEQQIARDEVIRLISNGLLVPAEDEELDLPLIASTASEQNGVQFSALAIEILIAASESEHGDIIFSKHLGGASFNAGTISIHLDYGRGMAKYEAAMQELEDAGLVKSIDGGEGCWDLTHRGFCTADELAALAASK